MYRRIEVNTVMKFTNRKFEDDDDSHDSPHCGNTKVVIKWMKVIQQGDQSKCKTSF